MITTIKNQFLGYLQTKLGKSAFCAKTAIKIRNQINGVIAAHLNDGIDMANNGEEWLIGKIAPKSKVFVDVGANTGEWTGRFIELSNNSKGILFEPSPSALSILQSKFESEQQKGSVEIVQAAVSDSIGTLDFFMEESAGETSSLLQKHSSILAKKISVNVTTIDEEMKTRGVDFIDLLKIDTEGFDFHVLRGADKFISGNNVGVVQFEYNHPWAFAGSTLAAAIDFLETRGYAVYLLKQGGLFVFDYKVYGEFLRYSNFVAIAPNYLHVTPQQL